jgi:K+-sensing histidine kinase KdpD
MSYALAATAIVALALLLALLSAVTSGVIQLGSSLLLGVVLVALTFGPGPSLLAALLGAFMLDYFILPPQMTWAHTNPSKAVSVVVFGLVGCAISLLSSRIQHARLRAEALARALQAEEQETERRMDTFLGVASHELKTPLTALLTTVQVVARKLQAMRALTGASDASGVSGALATHDVVAFDLQLAQVRIMLQRRAPGVAPGPFGQRPA